MPPGIHAGNGSNDRILGGSWARPKPQRERESFSEGSTDSRRGWPSEGWARSIARSTRSSVAPWPSSCSSRELCDNDEVVKRFLREGRTSNRVDHRNIVKVIDVDRDGDQLFIVQDLLEGEDLQVLLKRSGRRISLEDALDIVTPVADALGAAHAAGLVHRDLKPGNIFLSQQRGMRVPMVLDFGIAKVLVDDPEDNTPLHTKTGTSMGTPAYMSPEQIMAPREVDARSDVWALGILLYRSLAGCLPFDKESPGGLMVAICTEKPRPISAVVEGVPDVIAEVIDGCLARDPDDRFANGTAVARALEGARDVLAEEISGYQIRARPSQPFPQRVGAHHIELELETPLPRRSAAPRSTTRPKVSSVPPDSSGPPSGHRVSGRNVGPQRVESTPAPSSGRHVSLPPTSYPSRPGMGSSGSRARPPISHPRLEDRDLDEPVQGLPQLGLAVLATTPLVVLGWGFRARGGAGALLERLGGQPVLVLSALVALTAALLWRRPSSSMLAKIAALGFGGTALMGVIAGATLVNGGQMAAWLARPGGFVAAAALGALALLAGERSLGAFGTSPVNLAMVVSHALAALVAVGIALRLVM